MTAPLAIRADHPAFDGHFPGFPVLPGAVLLDEALQELERTRRIDLLEWRIASVKFLEFVRPGAQLNLRYSESATGSIRLTIGVEGRPVATATLEPVDLRV